MSAIQHKGQSCGFPDSAWSPEFRGQSQSPTVFLPSDWRTRVILPDPVDVDMVAECATLASYLPLRTPQRKLEIVSQAKSDMDAVWPVQSVAGDPHLPPHPSSIKLVRALLNEIWGPIFFFKERFNRGRPYHCCAQNLAPMFMAGPLYPGHPAYPSGHSTQAHSVAYVLQEIFPNLQGRLADAAGRVAQNREVAGLHYPSDSAAGMALARQLVDLLLAQTSFRTLLEAAGAEWP